MTSRIHYHPKPNSELEVLTRLRMQSAEAKREALAVEDQDSQEAAALRGKAMGLKIAADVLGGYLYRKGQW